MVPRRTLQPIQTSKIHNPIERKKRESFDALIERRWGTSINPPPVVTVDDDREWEEYEDNDESPNIIHETHDAVDFNGRLIDQQSAYDKLLNNKVMLQLGDTMQTAKVVQISLGSDGTVVGSYNDNPALKSIVYDVEFNDGTVQEYATNIIVGGKRGCPI